MKNEPKMNQVGIDFGAASASSEEFPLGRSRWNLSRKLEIKWDKWSLHSKFAHQLVFVIWLQLSPLFHNGPRSWWVWMGTDFFGSCFWLLNHRLRWLGRPSAPQPWWWHERWQILCDSHHPLSEQSLELGTHPCPRYPHLAPLCSLLAYTWTLQVSGDFTTASELQHLHFCQAIFGSRIFGNVHEALGCRWVPLLTSSTNMTGTRATNSYWNVY